jgi:hypothetical protein
MQPANNLKRSQLKEKPAAGRTQAGGSLTRFLAYQSAATADAGSI